MKFQMQCGIILQIGFTIRLFNLTLFDHFFDKHFLLTYSCLSLYHHIVVLFNFDSIILKMTNT